jgi:UDP-GlcNAc:undecaprenyl-phosphate/decaprenyl-phosphate GlcNAc-1-phosphate transferase
VREYLLAMLVALTVTVLLGGPVRALAIHFGAVGAVRDRDVHKVPTPRVGGIAMFGGFAIALMLAKHFPMLHAKAYANSNTVQALLWGATLVALLGVIDDRWELDALTKLAGQIFAASVMVVKGIQITWLPIPGFGLLVMDPTFGVVLSVLVVLILMNAVNFVDGLDGLAAGISCIAALATFAYSYRLAISYHLTGAVGPALISAVTVGICLGFLVHNWSPARMFMGDTGSMLLGLALAASAITITGQIDPSVIGHSLSESDTTHKLVPVYIPLLLPISVTLLPLADMFMAVVRRTKAGRSPLAADKEHLHHRLLQIGHSPRRAVLIMYFWSALVAFVTVLFSVSTHRKPVVYLAIAMTLVGLLMLLSPRLGDHFLRIRAASGRWRSDSATTAKHRARPASVAPPTAKLGAVPIPAIEADPKDAAEPGGGMRRRERTLSS